ncbi:hypothetical protein MXE38_10175 [Anaerobiospirillum sp. NML120448]|uniref:hypothetical protein n=1 Tax=Anaerobiospirillum sp. NML120448 TaxID=2932816 RepID=UPI001FF3E374|nr:hypothetical protein [Anaerobiospirillum sp. NML120448]MCK0515201.1 hypothetical protein [Anaerobiospirillum sp. NML120448]
MKNHSKDHVIPQSFSLELISNQNDLISAHNSTQGNNVTTCKSRAAMQMATLRNNSKNVQGLNIFTKIDEGGCWDEVQERWNNILESDKALSSMPDEDCLYTKADYTPKANALKYLYEMSSCLKNSQEINLLLPMVNSINQMYDSIVAHNPNLIKNEPDLTSLINCAFDQTTCLNNYLMTYTNEKAENISQEFGLTKQELSDLIVQYSSYNLEASDIMRRKELHFILKDYMSNLYHATSERNVAKPIFDHAQLTSGKTNPSAQDSPKSAKVLGKIDNTLLKIKNVSNRVLNNALQSPRNLAITVSCPTNVLSAYLRESCYLGSLDPNKSCFHQQQAKLLIAMVMSHKGLCKQEINYYLSFKDQSWQELKTLKAQLSAAAAAEAAATASAAPAAPAAAPAAASAIAEPSPTKAKKAKQAKSTACSKGRSNKANLDCEVVSTNETHGSSTAMVMDYELDPTCFNEIELSPYELNFDTLIAEELPLITDDAISAADGSAAGSTAGSLADCFASSSEDSCASSDLSEEEIDGANMMDEALSESSRDLEEAEETTDSELYAHQIEVQTNSYSALIKKLKNNKSSFNDMLSYLNNNLFGVNQQLNENSLKQLLTNDYSKFILEQMIHLYFKIMEDRELLYHESYKLPIVSADNSNVMDLCALIVNRVLPHKPVLTKIDQHEDYVELHVYLKRRSKSLDESYQDSIKKSAIPDGIFPKLSVSTDRQAQPKSEVARDFIKVLNLKDTFHNSNNLAKKDEPERLKINHLAIKQSVYLSKIVNQNNTYVQFCSRALAYQQLLDSNLLRLKVNNVDSKNIYNKRDCMILSNLNDDTHNYSGSIDFFLCLGIQDAFSQLVSSKHDNNHYYRNSARQPKVPSLTAFIYILEALEQLEAFMFTCTCGAMNLVCNPFLFKNPLKFSQSCNHCMKHISFCQPQLQTASAQK